jgi:ketosteroid isomerase-like protein
MAERTKATVLKTVEPFSGSVGSNPTPSARWTIEEPMTQSPEDVSKVLVARLSEGDIDGLRELYEPGAVFADFDGLATGWPAIARVHRAFLERGSRLALGDPLVIQAGEIALVQWTWTVTRDDGSELSGASAEVLRRQADGSWKFVIDNSDGAALIGEI